MVEKSSVFGTNLWVVHGYSHATACNFTNAITGSLPMNLKRPDRVIATAYGELHAWVQFAKVGDISGSTQQWHDRGTPCHASVHFGTPLRLREKPHMFAIIEQPKLHVEAAQLVAQVW